MFFNYSNNIIPLLLTGAGLIVLGKSLHGFYRSIGPLVIESDKLGDLTTIIYRRRRLSKGPKIVAMGGGTGLSVLLRGLKEYTYNLTAIVTVGDDGGSSGRLRKELGVVPPGDFRNCLVAMSDTESLVTIIIFAKAIAFIYEIFFEPGKTNIKFLSGSFFFK